MNVFSECNLGNLQIKNHIIRSATLEAGLIKNGEITEELKDIYVDLVKKDCALIITGMMGVGHNSCIFPGMARINTDNFTDKFGKLAENIHSLGGKIVVQLGHCGKDSSVIDYGKFAFAPSDYIVNAEVKAKEMSEKEIAFVTEEYGEAAKKCKIAGADGVQIHSAHGYLLSQFLSPYFNKRTDKYGGNIENRARFLIEVYKNIRQKVGNNYPILIKLNASDLVNNGFDIKDCLWVCKKMEELHVDAIELSAGLAVNKASLPFQSVTNISAGSFTKMAKDISDSVNVPIISVGGYRSLEAIENILNTTNIAAISMSRPFICETNLVERWKNGDITPSHCISCNQCLEGIFGCVKKRKDKNSNL